MDEAQAIAALAARRWPCAPLHCPYRTGPLFADVHDEMMLEIRCWQTIHLQTSYAHRKLNESDHIPPGPPASLGSSARRKSGAHRLRDPDTVGRRLFLRSSSSSRARNAGRACKRTCLADTSYRRSRTRPRGCTTLVRSRVCEGESSPGARTAEGRHWVLADDLYEDESETWSCC